MAPPSDLLRGLALVACAGLLAACAPAELAHIPASLTSPFTGYASPRYADPKMWLCRPDNPGDPCHGDLTATEIRPDGSRAIVPHQPAADPDVDCFYVYPTVDDRFFAHNHEGFADLAPMADATVAQVAHFTEACRLYVPLYRQITLGAYVTWASRREGFLAVAFSDVEDAFLHYMGQLNHGRKVVLIGHSQGAEMVMRLLRKRFDGDPAMRARLVVALPIGGNIDTALGQLTGGSLANIPMCSRPEEVGCVLGYRTHGTGGASPPGQAVPAEGRETMCLNPAGPGLRRFSRTFFPINDDDRKYFAGLGDLRTPFVLFRDFFAGRCVAGEDGYRYLEVQAAPGAGDLRKSPLDLGSFVLHTSMGMHVLDLQFPQGDLIDLVKLKAAAR